MYIDNFTKNKDLINVYQYTMHLKDGMKVYSIHHDKRTIVIQLDTQLPSTHTFSKKVFTDVLSTHHYEGDLEVAATMVFEKLIDGDMI